jgi:serine/threonine protein kinase
MSGLHPMHPAAWVVDQFTENGWEILRLLAFTRASTLILVRRPPGEPYVVKAGFGSDHVLAALSPDERPAAYGFYWYAEKLPSELALARDDFRCETALASAVTGAPHFTPVICTGEMEYFDWYAMPYCDGGNFRGVFGDRHSGLAILADTAGGLTALHDRGVIHRDVYQENILIHGGHGLITDLGAAYHLGQPRGPSGRGPEVHWPPEYATSYRTVTEAADVYSLAVLAYRHLTGDIPRPGPLPPSLPGGLSPLITAAFTSDPGRRPGMTDMKTALLRAAGTQR